MSRAPPDGGAVNAIASSILLAVLAVSPSYAQYNCQGDMDNWETAWSSVQKAWCCEHQQRACKPWDCYHLAQWTWPDTKKTWCCKHEGRGCAEVVGAGVVDPGGSEAYDCEDGYDRWELSWPLNQKQWCCKHRRRACDPYDCSAGVAFIWTPSKRDWCCREKGVHCTTTTPQQHDCTKDRASWESTWDTDKRLWCCREGAIPTCDRYDCRTGIGAQLGGATWSDNKAAWCCSHKQVGCTTTATTTSLTATTTVSATTTSVPYDCNVGLDAWEVAWTVNQKTWCCQVRGRACDAFNCIPGDRNPLAGWSLAKSGWCCKHHNEGCPATTSRPPLPSEYGGVGGSDLNCLLDLQLAAGMWSPEKKVICCVREGRGCPVVRNLDDRAEPVGLAEATLQGAYLSPSPQRAATHPWPQWLPRIAAAANLIGAGALVVMLGHRMCSRWWQHPHAQGERYEFVAPPPAGLWSSGGAV